jgi:hypothetical protein
MSQVFSPPPYLIDAHVHLHECFDEAGFFRAADENFRIAGSSLELDSAPAGVLMLTESSGTDRFSDLRRRARNREPSELLIEETGEDLSLLVATPAHRPLLVVAGRQVVTSENLEVLALGCTLEIPDGATLDSGHPLGFRQVALASTSGAARGAAATGPRQRLPG